MNARHPSGEWCETRVFRVSKAFRKRRTRNEFIDEVDVIATTSNGGTKKSGQGGMVRFSQIGEMAGDEHSGVGMEIEKMTKRALENNSIVIQNRAAPGSIRETIRVEVVGGSGEVREGNKGRQGVSKREQSSGEGEGGRGSARGCGAGSGGSGRRSRGSSELVVVFQRRSGGGGGGGGERARTARTATFGSSRHGGGSGFAHVRM